MTDRPAGDRPGPEGPPLGSLMRDLAAVSPDVWDPGLDVVALWEDSLADLAAPGTRPTPDLSAPATGPVQREAVAVTLAVLHAPSLRPWRGRLDPAALHEVVERMVRVLGAHVSPRDWQADPRAREEAARVLLDLLGLRPAGESAAVAADRLAALSSAGLAAALAEMVEEQRRAQELARQLAERRAREAAMRVTYV
ncbi:hypothetical protein [Georgenia thermotolerans]|uniref:Uncharacterized protein n=1 Tax=Georgenia thermotolerans TaxID=527326 RepID=A0A7J5UJ13_9MICO|nr:hypothetical protein [Georgenia thermotolerans]KAE8762296.1 hypothetical protein GB883_20085 [Georgenia thermotolerans]